MSKDLQDSHSQKRPRTDDNNETLGLQQLMSLNSSLQKLRLEAIFHPKFENEKSNHEIRNEMTQLVNDEQGYLEVTLKHSGSLVLWSGGQRFYSKNSLSNSFTLVAEILLRQHMERAWRNRGASRYEECSRHLQDGRLTCAFEVVTAVLGDHGDIPKRDFLILTAVADRSTERFYSTAQLVALAQQFRLPHNDAWAFTTASSAKQLFQLYDRSRETGLASDTIAGLSKTAHVHVASMYPHSIFQGEILEGFVVRYIPFPKGRRDQVQEQLQELATKSQEILQEVPPSLPPIFETENGNTALCQTNIRTVFEEVGGTTRGTAVLNIFAKTLEEILAGTDRGNRRRVHRIIGCKTVDLPALTKDLLGDTDDRETQRIAELLQTLSNLNKAVTYTMVQEHLPLQVPRNLCVIHVIGDQTFLKFQNAKDPDAMNLFRGFCIELGTSDKTDSSLNDSTTPMECEEQSTDAPFLMLKMKLLPYMVRTFLCRNQLNVLQQQGPGAYVKACSNLLDKWSMSSQAKVRWIPFLEQWAVYAKGRMDNSFDDGMPPLNSFSYLKHLEHFRELFEKGQSMVAEAKGFRGMVCVIAPTDPCAQVGAEAIARAVECRNVLPLTDAAARWVTNGVICFGTIDKQKKYRDFLGETADYLVVVMYGCSPEEIEAELQGQPTKAVKACIGQCRSWDKQPCHIKINLAKNSIVETIGAFQEAVAKIAKTTALVPDTNVDTDQRPGVFVFFPGIPGCGKSSLVNSAREDLEKRLGESCSVGERRKVHVIVGDEHGKAFWDQVKTSRRKDESSILIADKNTPPPSWQTVGTTCSSTSAFPLAVFPDNASLKTTRILGSRRNDGNFDPNKSHFYPFSLEYLAICIARVLQRPPSSHLGKLDSGTPAAAMIVVMFYSFYRYKSAEEFRLAIDLKLKAAGTMDSLEPIRLPFMIDNEEALPTQVIEALTEALQLQLGYDGAKKKIKISDPLVKAMEDKLRNCIHSFQDELLSKAIALEVSKAAFIDEIAQRVQGLGMEARAEEKPVIKLVSIDVPRVDIHQILKDEVAAGTISEFVKMCIQCQNDDVSSEIDRYDDKSFVRNTHVTMLFWQESPQEEMKEKFSALLGAKVEILATALLWDNSVAALEVNIAETTVDGRKVPASKNEFVHLTVWVSENAKAFMSNRLPQRVKLGEAQRVELAVPVRLNGLISFWDSENNVIPILEP